MRTGAQSMSQPMARVPQSARLDGVPAGGTAGDDGGGTAGGGGSEGGGGGGGVDGGSEGGGGGGGGGSEGGSAGGGVAGGSVVNDPPGMGAALCHPVSNDVGNSAGEIVAPNLHPECSGTPISVGPAD